MSLETHLRALNQFLKTLFVNLCKTPPQRHANRTLFPFLCSWNAWTLYYRTQIVNDSLTSGIFPQTHKSAVVKPLLKKPTLDHNNLKKNRPVSNLSFLSKIIGKNVLFQMSDHVCSNSLLNPFQSAYKPGHSTETALLEIVSDLLLSLSVLTFLDLSAPIDTIDHNILLSRLEHVFGIHGTALQWFSPYLSNRTKTVSINNLKSDPASQNCKF